MDNGFIIIHRKMTKWEWYQKSEMVHLFLHLLLLANHEQGNWQGHTIERGQLITGLHSLKRDTGISTRTLRTCLERLKSTGEITSKTTNKFRIITIVKYEDYQSKKEKTTSKTTSKTTNNRQSNDKQPTTNNNVNNDNNENNIYSEPSSQEEFSFKNQLNKMFLDKNKRMPIIAYYWTIKGFNFDNKQKYSAALKRELRPAGDLIGYSNEDIKRTCEWLKNNADFKWTLETVLKYIDEPLENMKAGGKLQTEEDYIKSLKQKHYGAN